mmetsp:Transcript_76999/g.168308  ORF Transcript_76999/g.168308 Transcript_76999/m.168308 type:complete len:229 (+) Transcript_76999:764-1450(+)
MQTLVARNQLVGEGQARHESALLQPVDGTEGAAEEDALDTGKGQQPFRKAVLVVHPLHRPLGLLLNSRHSVDGIEDLILLCRVFDVLFDEERIGLGVNVLHGDLESIEGSGFWDLDFSRKVVGEILVHDSIRGSEESQNCLHEVLFLLREIVPVFVVLCQIDLLCCPEGGLMLLVHLVDLVVLDWEENPAARILLQKRVILLQLLEFGTDSAERSRSHLLIGRENVAE